MARSTRYFLDCEFVEARGRVLEPVSVGVVAEDGRELYGCCADTDLTAVTPFVTRHVLPQLPPPSSDAWRDRATLRDDLLAFLTADGRPEIWAWVAPYDHVVVAQLFGDMTALPRELPRWTRDARQLWWHLGSPRLPKQRAGQHDALADARHVRRVFVEHLAPLARERGLVV